jgi:hypothetical protein
MIDSSKQLGKAADNSNNGQHQRLSLRWTANSQLQAYIHDSIHMHMQQLITGQAPTLAVSATAAK